MPAKNIRATQTTTCVFFAIREHFLIFCYNLEYALFLGTRYYVINLSATNFVVENTNTIHIDIGFMHLGAHYMVCYLQLLI